MFTTYRPRLFMQLKSYNEASRQIATLRQPIETLLGLIREYDIEDYIGVQLLYRHFDLGNDERIVEEKHASCHYSDIKPEKFDPELDEHDTTGKLMPYTWQVVEEGQGNFHLCPLEFVKNEEGDKQIEVGCSQMLVHGEKVVAELCQTVVNLGVANLLGFTVRHRAHITKIDASSVEYVDTERRFCQVVPASMEPFDDEMRRHYKYHQQSGVSPIVKGPTAWFVETTLESLAETKLMNTAKIAWCVGCTKCGNTQ